MTRPPLLLLVKFSSPLSLEEVERVIHERIDEFRALRGLRQKYYLQDLASGEFAGLYVWDSPEDLDDYRRSALRATIGEAYRVEGEPRVEVYNVVEILRDE